MSLDRYNQDYKRAFGIFENRADLEAGLGELRRSGYPMEKVSVVKQDGGKIRTELGNDTRVNDRIEEPKDNQADKGASTGAVVGGTLGGITGLLVGLGTLAIPGVGPILLAGATATALATALAGGAIGAATGGLLGALAGLNVPEDKAKVYQDRIYRGDFLVIIEGDASQIDKAEDVLKDHGVEDWQVYNVSDREPTPNPVLTNHDTKVIHNDRPTVFAENTITREQPTVIQHNNNINERPTLIENDSVLARGTQPTVVEHNTTITTDNSPTDLNIDKPIIGVYERPDLENPATAVGYGTPGYPNQEARVNSQDIPTSTGYGTPGYRAQDPGMMNNDKVDTAYGTPVVGRQSVDTGYGTPVVGYDNIDTNSRYTAVCVYPNSQGLRNALDTLRNADFPRDHISVISKHDDNITESKADEGAKAGAVTGGALGGLGGLLVGLGVLAIPGVGPVLVGGALATALATTAAGGAIGATAGGLTGGLIGLGIPEKEADFYRERVVGGDYLLVLEGSESELLQAKALLNDNQNWQMYKGTKKELSKKS